MRRKSIPFVLVRRECGHASWNGIRGKFLRLSQVGMSLHQPSFPWARSECVECTTELWVRLPEAEVTRAKRVFSIMDRYG